MIDSPQIESNQSSEDNSSKLMDSQIQTSNELNGEISRKLKMQQGQLEDIDCPICMNNVENRAYTDSCFHEFCVKCIEKWSHNHNKCPICRQTYSSIIHGVVSNTEYERIPISKPLNNRQSGMLLIDNNMGLLFTPLDVGVYMINSRQTPHGIRQNLLFLAPNQNFILQNMTTNVTFVRPEELDQVLRNFDETEAVGQLSYDSTRAIPVVRETQ